MVIGIIAYFLLEPDEIKAVNAAGEKVSRNKAAMDNVILALKNKNIWLVSFNVFRSIVFTADLHILFPSSKTCMRYLLFWLALMESSTNMP